MKNNHCARKRKVRIFRAQQGDVIAGDLDVFANINSRSSRRLHSRRVARIGQERDLSGLRLIEPRGALDLDVACTRATSRAGLRGEFGKFHGREFSAIFGKSDKVVFSLSLWERVRGEGLVRAQGPRPQPLSQSERGILELELDRESHHTYRIDLQ